MDKKPIRRSEHILQLSREHHFSLLFCWKIRQGLQKQVEPNRITAYVKHFWELHVIPHFAEEEQVVFPHLQDDKVNRAINEHEELRKAYRHLMEHPDKNPVEQLTHIADKMDAHVRYEERDLFPHIEKSLPQETLEMIGRQIDSQMPPDNYTDEFWQRNSASL